MDQDDTNDDLADDLEDDLNDVQKMTLKRINLNLKSTDLYKADYPVTT